MSSRSKHRYYHPSQANFTSVFNIVSFTMREENNSQPHHQLSTISDNQPPPQIASINSHSTSDYTVPASEGLSFCEVSPSICPVEAYTDIAARLKQIQPTVFTTSHLHLSSQQTLVVRQRITLVFFIKHQSTRTSEEIYYFIASEGTPFSEVSPTSICPVEAHISDTAALEIKSLFAEMYCLQPTCYLSLIFSLLLVPVVLILHNIFRMHCTIIFIHKGEQTRKQQTTYSVQAMFDIDFDVLIRHDILRATVRVKDQILQRLGTLAGLLYKVGLHIK